MSTSPTERAAGAWILLPEEPSPVRIWGLTPLQRTQRALARAGCSEVRLLAAGQTPPEPGAPWLLVRADWILDERLVEALADLPDTLLRDREGRCAVAGCASPGGAAALLRSLREGERQPPPGVRALGPDALAPAYTAKLRKSQPPYLEPARPEHAAEIEAQTFRASYKGATDLVTKWLWPRPALAVTRRLARAGVHPNTVTSISWVLALAAFALFWRGDFGLGLVLAWAMTFLDTVDGKLARVTLTSSRLGDVLDHGLDLIHPPFWWWAWGVGLGWSEHPATWVVVGGYFAGRALEGAFLAAFGFETHSWRPLDILFRTITARRNPNLILLSVGALAGRADLGLVLVAAWTLASLAFHAQRLLQAGWLRRRGGEVVPWDTAGGPS